MKKIYSIVTALLIALLAISPAAAGGVSGKITLGSIKFDGNAWGFGKDAIITIDAQGVPLVYCYAPGNTNPAPGQNPPRVNASDSQPATDYWLGKGKFEVHLEANADTSSWTPQQAGCPNNNWSFDIAFVFWDKVTIYVVNAKGDVMYKQNYTCVTTHDPDTITCTEAP